jgi:hypothetical protein
MAVADSAHASFSTITGWPGEAELKFFSGLFMDYPWLCHDFAIALLLVFHCSKRLRGRMNNC